MSRHFLLKSSYLFARNLGPISGRRSKRRRHMYVIRGRNSLSLPITTAIASTTNTTTNDSNSNSQSTTDKPTDEPPNEDVGLVKVRLFIVTVNYEKAGMITKFKSPQGPTRRHSIALVKSWTAKSKPSSPGRSARRKKSYYAFGPK